MRGRLSTLGAQQAKMNAVCGSPIEVLLLQALLQEACRLNWSTAVLWCCQQCRGAGQDAAGHRCTSCDGASIGEYTQLVADPTSVLLVVYLQHQIGPHRVDFHLHIGFPGTPGYVRHIVECDGHAAHASKEQRTADAQRDRYLLEQGYRVQRFTGSEIWRNAAQCASEALRILQSSSRGTP